MEEEIREWLDCKKYMEYLEREQKKFAKRLEAEELAEELKQKNNYRLHMRHL